MAQAKVWKNVAVAMQSAIGADLTISAITKANPGEVTSTAHGLLAGEYVLLTVQGMSQLNGRVARVANPAANTFELEGIDTTNFDTFTVGTAALITYGTSISTITTLNASGGEFDSIDTTTIHQGQRTSILGLPSEIEYSFENIWDVSEAGLIAMKAASDLGADRAFKFTFGIGGNIMVFNGRVGATLLPTGQAQALVTTPAKITMVGSPSYYAS